MSELTTSGVMPRHPGPSVTLGTVKFVMPPMSMKIRKMEANARRAMGPTTTPEEEEALVTQVVLLTLQRNYPDLTVDGLDDLTSYPEVLEAYLVLREEEARLMFALGERVATGALAPVAQLPSTESSQA